MNALGQSVVEGHNIYGNQFTFTLSDQAIGIYFVEINNQGAISRIKVVKN